MHVVMWDINNFEKTPYGVRDIRIEQGNGDWSINSFKYLIEADCFDTWGWVSFQFCANALKAGKRWPDLATKYVTADRKQTDVTRDCYVYCYACAVRFGYGIEDVKPPLRLYRPSFWAWRRKLLGKPNLYRFWRWVEKPTEWFHPWYVEEMNRYMEMTLQRQSIQKLMKMDEEDGLYD